MVQEKGTVPFCLIDRNQMKQVLLNLFKNAKEAMPSSGGKITVTVNVKQSSNPQTLNPNPSTCIISIKDNGIGISEEDQKKIFQKFKTDKKIMSE